MKITNFFYNTFIELYLALTLILWAIGACTLVIPFLWYVLGGDYFYIKDYIEDTRDNKI